jgi:hypothetical protein
MDYFESGTVPPGFEETLSLKEASFQVGKSPDTVARWCKQHGIGRQLHPHAPWLVDPVGLAICAAADGDAMFAYKQQDWASPSLAPYLGRRAA